MLGASSQLLGIRFFNPAAPSPRIAPGWRGCKFVLQPDFVIEHLAEPVPITAPLQDDDVLAGRLGPEQRLLKMGSPLNCCEGRLRRGDRGRQAGDQHQRCVETSRQMVDGAVLDLDSSMARGRNETPSKRSG